MALPIQTYEVSLSLLRPDGRWVVEVRYRGMQLAICTVASREAAIRIAAEVISADRA